MNKELVMVIAELIVAIAAAICSKYVIPWIKQSTDERTLNTVIKWVGEAVHAADQIMSRDQWQEKKQYVVDFVTKILKENNIDISAEQLDILIESAVKQIRLQDSNS